MGKFGEWFRWAMAVLVIPIVLWGIKLEVNRAVMEERVETMKIDHAAAITRLTDDLKEAQGIDKSVQANNGQLIKLSTQMDGMTGALREIKELIRAQ